MQNTQFYIQQFYQYAGWPKYNKYSNTYNACCPICREGKSWGRKKRLYYIVEDNAICCHNCGWYSDVIKWVMEVSGKTYSEIVQESGEMDITELDNSREIEKKQVDSLPVDSINLFDKKQVKYYHEKDSTGVVTAAIQYIVSRKLHVAINRPRSLYMSLTDKVHKNRICLPFMHNNKVVHYQTRGILNDDLTNRPKYLSKINSEKSLFNVDQIVSDVDEIFITEGPIDACFVKNGVAVAGIQENSRHLFTNKQQKQINSFPLHRQVWCLDSQFNDTASLKKTCLLIERGCSVFIWPRETRSNSKDFNDICLSTGQNHIDINWILQNTFKGAKARLQLNCRGRL